MPQLSPLNWIMLFTMFWLILVIMCILIWWDTKNMLYMKHKKSKKMENKWLW